MSQTISTEPDPGTDPNAPAQNVSSRNRVLILLVIAAAALGLLLAVLGPNVIAPAHHYNAGVAALEKGSYKDAVEEFQLAGDHQDAADLLAVSRQKYADLLAGKENALSYVSSAVPWFSMKDDALSFDKDRYEKSAFSDGNLIVPDLLDWIPVVTLRENVFLNASSLLSVTLPDSVVALPDGCFYNCDALAEVALSPRLERIGERAFINCKSLKTVSVPATVVSIGARAWNNCHALESAALSCQIEQLAPYTFAECFSLAEISLPGTLKEIGEGAFADCVSLKTVRFAGTEAQWNEIRIGADNDALSEADILFVP